MRIAFSAVRERERPPAARRAGAPATVLPAAALTVLLAAGCAASGAETPARPQDAASSAFFARYVRDDGRVVREDEGGDTVSEGQAYALLLALHLDDRARFDAVWSWTRDHLQRPDRLLSYLWRGGRVVDDNAAADADIDTAVALLRAGETWDDAGYTRAGRAVAAAVLAHESVSASPGRLVAAGPWAVGDAAFLNPSYVVEGTAMYLAEATGDDQWRDVARATRVLDRSLAGASALPSDWARLGWGRPASAAVPAPAPDGSAAIQYGLDAPRLVIRLATSCSATDRRLAAELAPRLGEPGAVGRRSLDGAPLVDWRNALTDVALYAARRVSGDAQGARAALRSAAALNRDYPTYYGTAWLALAPAMLADSTEECA